MSYFTAGTGKRRKGDIYADQVASRSRGGRGRHGRCGVLKLVVQHKRGERHAVQRLSFSVGRGGIRRRAEDRDDRWRERGHQRPGVHPGHACGTRSPRPADGSSPARWPGAQAATNASGDSGPFGAVQAKTTGALSGARHTTILQ